MAGGHLRQLVDPEISFIEKSNLQFDKNLQMFLAILIKKFRANAFFMRELRFDIYTTSVLADFFLGEVDTVGCSADGIA